MLRFFRNEQRLIVGGAEELALIRRPLRPARFAVQACAPAIDEAGLLAAVSAGLQRLKPTGQLILFLPSSWFIYWTLPWVDSRLNEAQARDLAATLLRQDFDLDPAGYALALSPAGYRRGRLVCAIKASLLLQIRQQAPAGLRLLGVHPTLALAWPRLWRGPAEPMLFREPGFAALLTDTRDGLGLHTRRLGHAPDHAEAGVRQLLQDRLGDTDKLRRLQLGHDSTAATLAQQPPAQVYSYRQLLGAAS